MLIPAQKLKELYKSDNTIVFRVVLLWAFTGFLFYLGSQIKNLNGLSLALFGLIFLSIGWIQFALLNANHDALHKNFGAPHREYLGWILTGFPLGLAKNYRKVHLLHHRFFGDPNRDPDYQVYGFSPKTKLQFILKISYNLTGIAAANQFLSQFAKNKKNNFGSSFTEFLEVFATQLALFLIITVVWNPFAYIIFWLLPIATISKTLAFLRGFSEHSSPSGKPVIRTITGNIFDLNWLGIFSFNYHSEHHAYPIIPFTNLKKAHEFVGKVESKYEVVVYNKGYLGYLFEYLSVLPFVNKDNDLCSDKRV